MFSREAFEPVVCSDGHERRLIEKISFFRQSGMFCDTKLMASDGILNAHGVILAASSPFFSEAINAFSPKPEVPGSDNRSSHIEMMQFNCSLLEAVLQVIYTGSSSACESNSLRSTCTALGLDLVPEVEDDLAILPLDCVSSSLTSSYEHLQTKELMSEIHSQSRQTGLGGCQPEAPNTSCNGNSNTLTSGLPRQAPSRNQRSDDDETNLDVPPVSRRVQPTRRSVDVDSVTQRRAQCMSGGDNSRNKRRKVCIIKSKKRIAKNKSVVTNYEIHDTEFNYCSSQTVTDSKERTDFLGDGMEIIPVADHENGFDGEFTDVSTYGDYFGNVCAATDGDDIARKSMDVNDGYRSLENTTDADTGKRNVKNEGNDVPDSFDAIEDILCAVADESTNLTEDILPINSNVSNLDPILSSRVNLKKTLHNSQTSGNIYCKRYTCRRCMTIFVYQVQFRRHKLLCTVPFPIHIPSQAVQTAREKVELKTISCQVCAERFTYKLQLKRHQEMCGNPQARSDAGDISITKLVPVAKTSLTEQRPYICPYCNRGFRRRCQMRNHCVTHTDDRPSLCTECGMRFRNERNLRSHKENVHRPDRQTFKREKKHLCTVCGKRFALTHSYIVHARVHNGERPFQCPVCNIQFKQACSLQVGGILFIFCCNLLGRYIFLIFLKLYAILKRFFCVHVIVSI